jgi:hypothetical protein
MVTPEPELILRPILVFSAIADPTGRCFHSQGIGAARWVPGVAVIRIATSVGIPAKTEQRLRDDERSAGKGNSASFLARRDNLVITSRRYTLTQGKIAGTSCIENKPDNTT